MNYQELGFKAGLEIHQQIEGLKLFCRCPALVNDDSAPTVSFTRKLRAAAGELGMLDKAALYEMKKDRVYHYDACPTSSCLVEFDEEPPSDVNKEALTVALEVAQLLHAKIVEEIHFMRKTVIDGSNVSAFQRTALVATDGYIETSKGNVNIPSICLEEEAAKKIEEKPHAVQYRLDRLGVALIEIATDASIKDPDHAREVASYLGMVLRSTGKVKRGIGTIRQDVNVSIKGHPRVELKGFQELRSMPLVIENEIRRQMKEKGEAHVRKVNADGTTTYLRPMPGAARMYPETDILPIRITKTILDSLTIHELLDEKALTLEKRYHLPGEVARELIHEDIPFESYLVFSSLEPAYIAQVLITYPKEIKKRYNLDASTLKDEDYKQVLRYLDEKKIAKEAVLDMLVDIIQGKGAHAEKYATVSDETLEKELQGIIAANKGASLNALMGEAMKKFRGKVDGKKIMDALKKLM